MKVFVVRKGGSLKGVGVPNPALKVSCAIAAGSGMRIDELDSTGLDLQDRLTFSRQLRKVVGADLTGEAKKATVRSRANKRKRD